MEVVTRSIVSVDGLDIPLLDLVEALEKGNRDEDNNGLPAVSNLDLLKNPGVSLKCSKVQ